MRIVAIIPVFNESQHIKQTLKSLLDQSYPLTQILVVNDNSTDDTLSIVQQLARQHHELTVVTHHSSAVNMPGSKVIQAFNYGLSLIDVHAFDIICKFDGDLIFPLNYCEVVVSRFRESEKTAIAAGFCTVLENETWIIEKGTNKDHVRGALKAYRRACFEQIGGLKPSIGWDTVDEMLARFYGWNVVTIPGLHVKHLKPTGATYNPKARYLQGEAFYKMRYGWTLTAITALKIAVTKKNIGIFKDHLTGYSKAQKKDLEPLVTAAQGDFIRSYRWNGIFKKLGFRN